MFQTSSICSHSQNVSLSFSNCSLSEYLPSLLSCAYALKFLRILRVTFPLLILLLVENGVVGYWLPFRSFRDYVPPNSIGEGKCRCHLQATRGIPTHPLLGRAYLRLTSFIGRILPSSQFSLAKNYLGSILGCLSLHGVMTRAIQLLGQNNILYSPLFGSNLCEENPSCLQSHLMHKLAEGSVIPFLGLHVLSVFQHNTSLHAT